MGFKELRQKYGKTSARAVNAAIRAEMPGGGIILDLLTKTHPLKNNDPQWADAYQSLLQARNEMFNAVAEKYGLQKKEMF